MFNNIQFYYYTIPKYWEILGNIRKYSEIFRNIRNSWKIRNY